ncbi:pyridoxamine 5'-phosphate oxidase-domain-containing protein [Crassisporium funariophilum]|nr:pyridoxamine 5'-phosphate oxidase-domain-containing protein [Crassisporium funariophilum]
MALGVADMLPTKFGTFWSNLGLAETGHKQQYKDTILHPPKPSKISRTSGILVRLPTDTLTTTTMSGSTAPRWKTALADAFDQYKFKAVLQLATIDANGIPRVRSLTFREFLVDPANPSLPLLLCSSDVRTPKINQIVAHPKAELVWWVEPTKHQFRIIADVHISPDPAHDLSSRFQDGLKDAGAGTALVLFGGYDWEAKRRALFKTSMGAIKASMCRPVTGSRVKEDEKEWPQTLEDPDADGVDMPQEKREEARRNLEEALSNFALIVVDPIEVDLAEFSRESHRTHFSKKSGGQGWDEVMLHA